MITTEPILFLQRASTTFEGSTLPKDGSDYTQKSLEATMSTRWSNEIPMEEVTPEVNDNSLLDWSERSPEGEWSPEEAESEHDEKQETNTPQDLAFQDPVFVQLPLSANSSQPLETTTIPPQRVFAFRGNYRRFLILLFGALASPTTS